MSEIGDDGNEVVIFFFHLLMMASALFCLSGSDEGLHCLKNLVHPPHMSIHKVFVVDL